jgi:hypothetical protein
MFLTKDDFALEDLNATGQPVLLRILIPLIQDIEFLRGGFAEIFRTADDPCNARSAGTVETSGFHLDAGFLAGIQQLGAGWNLGGDIGWENGDLRHGTNKWFVTSQ